MVGSRHLTLAGNDVQGKVLHGGVEDFLHAPGKPVNLINKQHIPGIQVGEQGCQISGLFNGRAAGHPQAHPQLVGDNPRQGGFAQARRAVEQHMVQGLLPLPGRLDKHRQIFLDFLLSNIIGEMPGPQGILHCRVLRVIGRVYHPVFKVHFRPFVSFISKIQAFTPNLHRCF